MQQDLIKKIVRLVPAFRVVKDAGQRVHREKEDGVGARFYTQHPTCPDERLYLTEYDYVEAGKSTGFFAGNAFDYLALIEGSLPRAIDVFFERYRDKIHTITAYEEGLIRDVLTRNAERTRRGYNFLNKLSINYQNSSAFHDVLSWQRGKHMNPLFLTHWVYPALPAQVLEFLESMFDSEADHPFEIDPTHNYLVIPYYNTWSNISHIVFEQPTEGRRYRVDLNPCRVAWAGLHGSPHFRPTRASMFYNTPREAMIMQSHYRDRLDDSLCLHTDISRDFVDANTVRFMRGVVLADKKTNFTVCARLADCVDQLHVQRFDQFAAQGEPVSWARYLAEELHTITNEDGENSPRARALLSNVEINSELRVELESELVLIGSSASTRELISNWSGGDTYRFRTSTVEETKHGYLVSYPNRADETLVSNFTIDVERNVVMADTGQVLMTGTVRMGDVGFPFEMDRKQCATPRSIEESVLASFNRWLRSDQRNSRDQRVPVITVPDQARVLSGVLGQKCANVPFDEGYSALGWAREDIFIAPFWMRQELKLTEGRSPVVTEGFNFATHYRYAAFPQQLSPRVTEIDFLSYEARNLLRTLIVWMVRGSLGYDTVPERIQDGASARNMLKAVCSVFGQVSPLLLNPSARKNRPEKLMRGLSRLPLYANSNNPEVLGALSYPMWILGDTGVQIDNSMNHIELHMLTNTTYHLVNRVIDWIATGGASGVIAFKTSTADQQQEAEKILKRMRESFGEDPVVDAILGTPPCARWMQVLSGEFDSQVTHLVNFDLESGMYVMGKRQRGARFKLPHTNPELIAEIAESGYEVEEREGKFWVPREFMEHQIEHARKEPLKFSLYGSRKIIEVPKKSALKAQIH